MAIRFSSSMRPIGFHLAFLEFSIGQLLEQTAHLSRRHLVVHDAGVDRVQRHGRKQRVGR